jgi:hypothetical protein
MKGGATAAGDPEHGLHAGLPHPRHLLPAPLHHPASRGGGDALPAGGGHRYDSRPRRESRLHREAYYSAERQYNSQQGWGSVTFWCGSGSPDPYRYLWLMDLTPYPTPFFNDFKDVKKCVRVKGRCGK